MSKNCRKCGSFALSSQVFCPHCNTMDFVEDLQGPKESNGFGQKALDESDYS
jgi:uncharacterized OB-fold protein